MSEKAEIHGTGFVLGHGVINNPARVRRAGPYAYVGVTDADGEWEDVRPTTDGVPGVTWLAELGPGRLVFIPDSFPTTVAASGLQLVAKIAAIRVLTNGDVLIQDAAGNTVSLGKGRVDLHVSVRDSEGATV